MFVVPDAMHDALETQYWGYDVKWNSSDCSFTKTEITFHVLPTDAATCFSRATQPTMKWASLWSLYNALVKPWRKYKSKLPFVLNWNETELFA